MPNIFHRTIPNINKPQTAPFKAELTMLKVVLCQPSTALSVSQNKRIKTQILSG